MGTLLKYIFYIILIIVIYLVGRGIYEGQITEDTTVGEVMDEVGEGTKDIVKKGVDATIDAADTAADATQEKANEAEAAVRERADDYESAPKKEIVVE